MSRRENRLLGACGVLFLLVTAIAFLKEGHSEWQELQQEAKSVIRDLLGPEGLLEAVAELLLVLIGVAVERIRGVLAGEAVAELAEDRLVIAGRVAGVELALDLAPHGIRVNAVSPGHVPVPTLAKMRSGEIDPLWPSEPSPSGLMGPLMRQRSSNIPMGRSAEVDEIAQAVLYLSSEASSYVIGQNLVVDGGWLLV